MYPTSSGSPDIGKQLVSYKKRVFCGGSHLLHGFPVSCSSGLACLENISLTFNKEESYDYLGRESNLMDLDMQKAISDMKRDSVLQEYQYFVGNSGNFFMNPADGIVIPK